MWCEYEWIHVQRKWIPLDSCEKKWICLKMCEFICCGVNMNEFTWIHLKSYKFIQTCANICKLVWIHVNLCKNIWTFAKTCELIWVCLNSGEFKWIQMNFIHKNTWIRTKLDRKYRCFGTKSHLSFWFLWFSLLILIFFLQKPKKLVLWNLFLENPPFSMNSIPGPLVVEIYY